jgi:hypothetical protein
MNFSLTSGASGGECVIYRRKREAEPRIVDEKMRVKLPKP